LEKISPESVAAEKKFYNDLLEFVRAKCQVAAPIGTGGLEILDSASARDVLGLEAMSAVASAADSIGLLVSDDLPLRALAKAEHGIVSVGTAAVLKHLRARGVISQEEYHEAVNWLLERGYSLVSVDKGDIIWAFRKSEWSPKSEVVNILQGLAGPDCDEERALRIGLEVLYVLWNEPLPSATQQLSTDLVLQALVTGRDRSAVVRRLIKANGQRSAIWTPAMANIETAIRTWGRHARN
jgi:hypothetical protein